MNEEANTQNETDTAAITPGPGERLQAARIERGIAIEDLANKMHLSVTILESLENNQFEDITAPIFVKGYLRSYARIVDLDEREIIDLYVKGYMEGDPPIVPTGSSTAQRVHDAPGMRWGLWLILLLVCLALAGWWYQRGRETTETLSLDAATEPAPVARSVDTAPLVTAGTALADDAQRQLEQMPAAPVAPEPEPHAQPETVTPAIMPSDSPGAALDAAPEAQMPTITDVAGEAQATVEKTVDTAPVATAAAPSKPQTEASPVPPVADQPMVILNVTADTWADIRDASGRKLVYDLLRNGRRLQFEANPPLRVFFGNGRGVELSWKGQPVKLDDRIRADNTVRITLE